MAFERDAPKAARPSTLRWAMNKGIPMLLRSASILGLVPLVATPLSAVAGDNNSGLCREFLGHLKQRIGFLPFAQEEKETGKDDPNWTIPDADIDQDKLNDVVLLFRTGSGSLIPSDNSTLTVRLSSGGEPLTFEAPRFYVIRYKQNYYVIANSWQSNEGPIHTDIHSLNRKGILLLCSFKCGVEVGSCESR